MVNDVRVPLCYTSIIKYLFISSLGVTHIGVDNISHSKQPLRNFCCHRDVITKHRVTQGKYAALETRFASPTQLIGVTIISVTLC